MQIYLDPSARRGAARSIYDQIRDAIESGVLGEGDPLPPSRELAGELGVSRHTVTTAYSLLVAEGYLAGHAGGGTTVCRTATGRRSADRRSVLRPVEVESAPPTTLPPPTGGVDLRGGQPDPALFPTDEWRRCASAALHRPLPGYGEPAGFASLREVLAGWIGRSRGVIVDADQIIVTSGAQEAVHLVVRTMLRPGDPIAVEDPGYPPVRLLFEAIGLRVVAVPVDAEGIVVDQIPPQVKVVYTTPSHQSPSGVTMSLGRRRALLAFADRHDAAIIEDDYDSEFRHTDRPLEPLHRLDRSGRVAYVGTFSKTLSPSLRLGFVAMPDPLVDAAIAWRQLFSVQPSSLGQTTLQRFIEQGHLDRHLRRVRRIYRTRHQIVRQFVADGVDAGVLLPGPENHAGLHLSTVLPTDVSEDAIRDAARRRGIAISSFAECCVGPDHPNGMLIGFGMAGADVLERSLPDLRAVLERA